MTTLEKAERVYQLALDTLLAEEARYAETEPRPAYTLHGVSVDWPRYRSELFSQVQRAQELYQKALELEAMTNPFELQSDLGG